MRNCEQNQLTTIETRAAFVHVFGGGNTNNSRSKLFSKLHCCCHYLQFDTGLINCNSKISANI